MKRLTIVVAVFVILTNGFYSGPSQSGVILGAERKKPSQKLKPVKPKAPAEGMGSIVKSFSLEGKAEKRAVFNFDIISAGRISVKANWKGTAENLALILNGPG